MHHFLQKLHKAAAAAEKPTQLLTESIEALEALEVSAKGDNFEVHSENMMTAMSVLPAGFLLDYFPASLDVCGDDDDQYSILVAEFKSGNVMRWDVNAVNGFDRMIGGFVLCGLMASSHGFACNLRLPPRLGACGGLAAPIGNSGAVAYCSCCGWPCC